MFEDYFFTEEKDNINMTNSLYTLLQFLDHSYHKSYRDYIFPMNYRFETKDNFGPVSSTVFTEKDRIRYVNFIETFKLMFNV